MSILNNIKSRIQAIMPPDEWVFVVGHGRVKVGSEIWKTVSGFGKVKVVVSADMGQRCN